MYVCVFVCVCAARVCVCVCARARVRGARCERDPRCTFFHLEPPPFAWLVRPPRVLEDEALDTLSARLVYSLVACLVRESGVEGTVGPLAKGLNVVGRWRKW